MRTASFLLVLIIALSPTASAQENPAPDQTAAEQKAREHYAQGEAAFKGGQYEQALAEFEAGFATAPRPGFLLNIGHTQRKIGRLRNARSAYKKYLLMEPESKFKDNVLAVIAEIDSALVDEDRVDAAKVPVEPAPKSVFVAPASHAADAATPGIAVTAAASSRGPGVAESAPLYRRPWFWVAVGAVAVGAGAGIYLWQHPAGDSFQASGSLGSLHL